MVVTVYSTHSSLMEGTTKENAIYVVDDYTPTKGTTKANAIYVDDYSPIRVIESDDEVIILSSTPKKRFSTGLTGSSAIDDIQVELNQSNKRRIHSEKNGDQSKKRKTKRTNKHMLLDDRTRAQYNDKLKLWQSYLLKRVPFDIKGDETEQWMEQLSSKPMAFVYHNFLSKVECEYLIDLARPGMHSIEVAHTTRVPGYAGSKLDRALNVYGGAYIQKGKDQLVSNIEKRIVDYTSIPAEHGEKLFVMHYAEGGKFEPHYDTRNGIQRMITVLMYLSDVEEGGETIFPKAKGKLSEKYKCAKGGLSVKPKAGDALLFWSVRTDGTIDPTSLHGGCPVIKGNKWICTMFMHLPEYKNYLFQ